MVGTATKDIYVLQDCRMLIMLFASRLCTPLRHHTFDLLSQSVTNTFVTVNLAP